MIHRFSSHRQRLGLFLAQRLAGAKAYDSIAGYFRASILETASKVLERLGVV